MDLTQLKTFVTIAETSNLTKASEVLHLSQPALSAHIKALEEELGVSLFSRNPRGMKLTIAGEILKQDALLALDAAKKVLSNAKNLNGKINQQCNIGTISEPVFLRLGEMLSKLVRKDPSLTLNVIQAISGDVVDKILKGDLHGGFVIGNSLDSRIASIPIRPVTLRVVAPYGWKAKMEAADWPELAKMPWIAMPQKCSFHTIANNLFLKYGYRPQNFIAVSQETALRDLVVSGVGITIMREDMALEAAAEKSLVIWSKVAATESLNFIYLQSEKNTPIIKALLRGLKEVWGKGI